jgi:hypothetical protein
MNEQAKARDEGLKRYVSPHPLPTAHQAELLTVLSEEAAEIIVAASKMARFGRDDGYPGTLRTNSNDLGLEIGDLLEVVDRIIAAGLTTRDYIESGKRRKALKLEVYLQTEAP